jgi:hypothetical protein
MQQRQIAYKQPRVLYHMGISRQESGAPQITTLGVPNCPELFRVARHPTGNKEVRTLNSIKEVGDEG